jgi:hypothetical protein
MDSKTESLIREHGALGVGYGRDKRHVVNRRTGKTLCGREVASIFGVDLTTRRQISCLRCYKLAFTSVNAATRSTPDTPITR